MVRKAYVSWSGSAPGAALREWGRYEAFRIAKIT